MMVCISEKQTFFFHINKFLLVVRELPILSLANPGMERIVDSSTAEYTSMLRSSYHKTQSGRDRHPMTRSHKYVKFLSYLT